MPLWTFYARRGYHDSMSSEQEVARSKPHTEAEIHALTLNCERKLAVGRMDAFLDFMHEHNIDPETEELSAEQAELWREKEAVIIKWHHERLLAIAMLSETISAGTPQPRGHASSCTYNA